MFDQEHKNVLNVIRMEVDGAFAYYYFLKNPQVTTNKSLIIFLVGSGTESVLSGLVKFPKYLLDYSPKGFDFLMPDKININPSHQNNLDSILEYYTFEHRVSASAEAIDAFLNSSWDNYRQIQLWGISEGGKILPRVFKKIKNKCNITKIVLWASGGMSQYREFCILKTKQNLGLSGLYLEELKKIKEARTKISHDPNSLNKTYLGWPYRRWSSFLEYQPVQDMQEISISILGIHGAKDINCPVESSRFIQKSFKLWGKYNMTYWEFSEGDHFNMNFRQIIHNAVIWPNLN